MGKDGFVGRLHQGAEGPQAVGRSSARALRARSADRGCLESDLADQGVHVDLVWSFARHPGAAPSMDVKSAQRRSIPGPARLRGRGAPCESRAAMARYDRKDAAYRRAKQEGYRSRAAYKLIELDRRFALLRKGMRVVDLGCWPGAWMQYASEKVGPSGRVVGVDRVASEPLGQSNVEVLQGDVTDDEVIARIAMALRGPADVVLSDLAPKLTGVRHADAVRHAELVRLAIERSRGWLDPGGALVVKLFMDAEYQDLISELRRKFTSVRSIKPESTRQGSSELYTCARGLRSADD